MGRIKPWQVVVFVLAVGALGFAAWSFLSAKRPHLTDRVLVVDVQTGDLFEMNTGGRHTAIFPELNPETAMYSLVPVEQGEDGRFVLPLKSARMLGTMEVKPDAVDLASNEVAVTSASPKRTLKPGMLKEDL